MMIPRPGHAYWLRFEDHIKNTTLTTVCSSPMCRKVGMCKHGIIKRLCGQAEKEMLLASVSIGDQFGLNLPEICLPLYPEYPFHVPKEDLSTGNHPQKNMVMGDI